MRLTKTRTQYLLLKYDPVKPCENNAMLAEITPAFIEQLRCYQLFIDTINDSIKKDIVRIELVHSCASYLFIADGKYPFLQDWLDGKIDEDQYYFLDATPDEINKFTEENESDNGTYYGANIYMNGRISFSLIVEDEYPRDEFCSQQIDISSFI